MSYRGIDPSSDFYQNIIKRETRPFDLVYTELGNYTVAGAIRLSTAAINITIAAGEGDLSGDFQAAGGLLGISSIEESAQLAVHETSITLTGVNSVATTNLLSYPYLDRTTKIWRGLLDSENNQIGLPVLLFDGRINSAAISDDPITGESTVTISCSSQWFDFERKNGSKTNVEEQQKHFQGDLGMEYASTVIKEIKWGKN